MKRIRIHSWRGQCLLTRPRHSLHPSSPHHHRPNSTQASHFSSAGPLPYASSTKPPRSPRLRLEQLPSPLVEAALQSAKLAALHARLALPPRLPLQTLARTLVDHTADRDERFNNASLALLGEDLMGYYMSEHLICHYPRLPMDVIFAAQAAYVGPKALLTIAKEWGVQEAAEPGGEVDPGYLQFRWRAGDDATEVGVDGVGGSGRSNAKSVADAGWRRSLSSRIVYDDQFGELKVPIARDGSGTSLSTSQDAHANFVRAVLGALHLHAGRPTARRFFANHFLSRVLNLSALFDFRYPTRDLSRLCLREGFEPPVARLISETGRRSAHPVFVVAVYSGRDKLGEAAGGSLDEARNRAAAAALKGWYLYSPIDVQLPSSTEEGGEQRAFRPNLVDPGEIIT